MRIADLGGDAKSLLVALTNGTMQVFSWQGKARAGCLQPLQRLPPRAVPRAPPALGCLPLELQLAFCLCCYGALC